MTAPVALTTEQRKLLVEACRQAAMTWNGNAVFQSSVKDARELATLLEGAESVVVSYATK